MCPDLSNYRPSTWTALPALPLIGAGTSQVESLSGYLARLKDATGVTQDFLLRVIDGPNYSKVATDRSSQIGPGEVCRRRAINAGRLVGQNLLGATLASFSDVIQARGAGLRGARERRWCPLCLSEEEAGGLIERLLWCFSDYSHCTLHDVPILSACLSCGRNLTLVANMPLLDCGFCGHPLKSKVAYEAASPLQRWTCVAIEGLIAWSASSEALELDAENYQKFVQCLIDDGTLDRIRGVHPIFWRDTIRFRRRKPTFTTLINFAAIKSIDPIDILTDPNPASSSNLFPSEEVEGLIACDLGDYSVAARRVELLLKSLLESGTRYIPGDTFLTKLVSRTGGRFSLVSCPSYARLSALRGDRERQVMRTLYGNKCVQIALIALREGATKSKAASVVRRQADASDLAATHACLTAATILKVVSSKAFQLKK